MGSTLQLDLLQTARQITFITALHHGITMGKSISGKLIKNVQFKLRNEFHFSDVHGAMNCSGSHAM